MSRRMFRRIAVSASCLAAGVAVAFAPPAAPADAPSWIGGSVPVELRFDNTPKGRAIGAARRNAFLKAEPEATIAPPGLSGFSVFVHGVVERVRDPEPGETRWFADQALFVEDIYVRYETGAVAVRAGKLNPGFGVAWDRAPGIYGRELPEGYETTERIGLSGSLSVELGPAGTQRLSVGTFFLDTSPLAHSLIGQSRGTRSLADGGVSNTEDFSSWNLALDGETVAGIAGLGWHFAYMRQARGIDGTTDQTGLAAALFHEFAAGGGITLRPLVEYVRLDGLDGAEGVRRTYWSGGLQADWRDYGLAASWSRRRTAPMDDAVEADRQLQLTAEYRMDFGLVAQAGWKRRREAGETADTVGLRLLYAFGF